jgi:hypothetical protein
MGAHGRRVDDLRRVEESKKDKAPKSKLRLAQALKDLIVSQLLSQYL